MSITNSALAQKLDDVATGFRSFVEQQIDWLVLQGTVTLTDPYDPLTTVQVKTLPQIIADYEAIIDPATGTLTQTQDLLAQAQTTLADAVNAQSTFDGYNTTFTGYLSQSASDVTAAETARDAAQTHASNASASATAAAASETNAGAAASAAASSQSAAATSATNAATSATNAANSATAAATSETNAATSATNAANSATSASTSATNAAGSATAAATSETNAAGSASAAAGSASAASTSATAADGSATAAASSASAAATSETNAANSASSASTSATNAANSASAADSAKVAAEQARDEAVQAANFDPANVNFTGGSITNLTTLTMSGGNAVFHQGNDGAGSGLDADLLDGQQGSYYLDLANATGTLPAGRLSGTYSINISGNATSSTRVGIQDTRSQNPAPFDHIGITNHLRENSADGLSDGGTYHGILHYTHWTDASGGVARQIASTENGNLWHRFGSSSWGSWRKIWDSENDGAGSGLDADTLRGISLPSGTMNNEANKVVRTDGSGALVTGWIYTTSGDNGTTGISRIYASQDNYIRYYTPANFVAAMQPHLGPTTNAAQDVLTAKYMRWKNYGNSHVIIDASAGTAPNGAAISNTTPDYAWNPTYPTLMGWNGANTHGVRVDRSAYAETLGGFLNNSSWADFTGNRIPIRHSDGYLYSNYFNMTANETFATISKLAVEVAGDGFLRWQTPITMLANLSISLSGGDMYWQPSGTSSRIGAKSGTHNIALTSYSGGTGRLENTGSYLDFYAGGYQLASGYRAYGYSVLSVLDGLGGYADLLSNGGTGKLQINSTQVVSTRKTGWGSQTGTANRAGWDTSSVSLATLAQTVKALLDDLKSHGLIGA